MINAVLYVILHISTRSDYVSYMEYSIGLRSVDDEIALDHVKMCSVYRLVDW